MVRANRRAVAWSLAMLLTASTSIVLQGLPAEAGASPEVFINDVAAGEGTGGGTTPFTFTIDTPAPATEDYTMDVETTPVDATPGADYTSLDTQATIESGATETTVTVQVAADSDFEPNELFDVNLSESSPAFEFGKSSGSGEIQNDDPNPRPIARNDVIFLPPTVNQVSLNVTANDEDPNGDPLIFEGNTQPENGTGTVDCDPPPVCEFTVDGDPQRPFFDTFTYQIDDDSGLGPVEGTVTVIGQANKGRIAHTTQVSNFGNPSIYTSDWQDGSPQSLLTGSIFAGAPSFSLDGQEIVYSGALPGQQGPQPADLYLISSDGSDEDGLGIKLTEHELTEVQPDMSPDGEHIVYRRGGSSNSHLYLLDAGPDGDWGTGDDLDPVRLFEASQFAAPSNPSFSPDGRWIAWDQATGPVNHIWVAPFDPENNQLGLRTEITSGGTADDLDPEWGFGVLELYLSSTREGGDFDIFSIDAGADDDFSTTGDNSMTNITDNDGPNDTHPASAPDGTRIAFNRGANQFYSCFERNCDIFTMLANGSDVVKVTNNAFQDAEPSWGPECPDCDADPLATHQRQLALALRKHLKAIATIKVPDSFDNCKFSAITIQKRKSGQWKKVKTIQSQPVSQTGTSAKYKTNLPDKPGKYRAKIGRITVGEDDDDEILDDICGKATSPSKRHTH